MSNVLITEWPAAKIGCPPSEGDRLIKALKMAQHLRSQMPAAKIDNTLLSPAYLPISLNIYLLFTYYTGYSYKCFWFWWFAVLTHTICSYFIFTDCYYNCYNALSNYFTIRTQTKGLTQAKLYSVYMTTILPRQYLQRMLLILEFSLGDFVLTAFLNFNIQHCIAHNWSLFLQSQSC